MRRPAAATRPKPRLAKTASFPAPVDGWISNKNLSAPDARRPDGSKVIGAFVLENYFPIATGARMRRGSDLYATVGNEADPITSMFAYVNGNNEKLFATTVTAIYNISSPILPSNEMLIDDLDQFLVDDLGNILTTRSSIDLPDVTGLLGGDWSVVQFATAGGVFLRAVNGLDIPLAYDGAIWANTPAITVVNPTTLSYVWEHQNRLFFIEKDSLNAWYLPVDSIGGAAVKLPLGGVFGRGGSLLFGTSWSLETGDGLTNQCAFVTTEGEVAIFRGTDPSVAASWARIGVYRIGRPIGAKAHIRAGGDVVIATDVGFVPLSQAIQRDYSALSPSAVSYPIETAWNEAVASRSFAGWACEVWPTKQMVLVAPPANGSDLPYMFATNARTGAWGHFTGWDGTCLRLFGERLFFGSKNGKIVEAEVTGADQGIPYTSVCVPLFNPLKAPASLKTSLLMRATLRAPSEIVPRLSLQVDYSVNLPTAPDAAVITSTGTWGGGIWGESQWGQAAQLNVYQRWQSVGGSGYAIAPGVQITSGSATPADAELVQIDWTYDQGDIVT